MSNDKNLSKRILGYKQTINNDSAREIDNFEKNFLFLSTGFFSFTLIFVKDIFKITESECIFLLQFSWGSLIISIALIMATFLKSQWESDKAWDYLDYELTNLKIEDEGDEISEKDYLKIKGKINSGFTNTKKHLKCIRMFAIFFFLLGVILMACFININFYNTKSNNNEQTKSQTCSTRKNTPNSTTQSAKTAKDSTKRNSN